MTSDNRQDCGCRSERKRVIVGGEEEGKCVQVCVYEMRERELSTRSSKLQKVDIQRAEARSWLCPS